MNVLLIIMVDPSGKSGENIYSKEVAKVFARDKSINLSLISPKPKYAKLSELGINVRNVFYLPSKVPRQIRWHLIVQLHMFKAIQKLITKTKPSFIVASLKTSSLLPPLFSKVYRIPYILLVEGLGERNVRKMKIFPGAPYLFTIITWINARSARYVYVAYEKVKQRIDSLRGSKQSKSHLFQVAVDPQLFYPIPISIARKKVNLSLSDEDFVIGYIGSFKSYHSLPTLIEAASDLLNEIPKLKFLLVGDGPELKNIKDLVYARKLEKQVIFTDFIPHRKISAYISSCDMTYSVISHGHWGNPMKCYEYLACEKLVIVRETEDLKFITENNFGLVVKTVNPQEISKAIIKIYNLDKEYRREIGQAGRKYILKYHTWNQLKRLILQNI